MLYSWPLGGSGVHHSAGFSFKQAFLLKIYCKLLIILLNVVFLIEILFNTN